MLYRNQIFNRNNEAGLDYYKSLKKLFDIPIEHQLSLRINYLIDVNRFKKTIPKHPKGFYNFQIVIKYFEIFIKVEANS